jgi:threonine dehydrogenase-like Zn-dependent dehydrogenase
LSHNFRNATGIVRAPLRLPIKPNHVLVKIIYAGVNASDVSCYIFVEDLRAHLFFLKYFS